MPSKPELHWRQLERSLALLHDERVVWQHNHDKSEGKPYFHPLSLVDGTELTWLHPPDHPWHRALWFSWKYLNGLNYWDEDPDTGRLEGETEVVSVRTRTADDYSALIQMELSYYPPERPPVLSEKCSLRISPPDQHDRYRIDWESRFVATDQAVLFDRTPIPGEAGGVEWGGYAGLSLRMAKSTFPWRARDSEGRRDLEAHGQRARWLDFRGKTPGGETAGITIFDHPANPRHPTPWYVTMSPKEPFGYFSPALLFHEPYSLGIGKTLRLRYRVLVYPEEMKSEILEGEWSEWSRA